MTALRILMSTAGLSRQRVGRGAGRRTARHPGMSAGQAGQLASMLSAASFADSSPLIHAVISAQNEPEPTSPGIWSEPSKTNSVDSVAILAIEAMSSDGY